MEKLCEKLQSVNYFHSIASDHRIVIANLQLTLRSNQKKKEENYALRLVTIKF